MAHTFATRNPTLHIDTFFVVEPDCLYETIYELGFLASTSLFYLALKRIQLHWTEVFIQKGTILRGNFEKKHNLFEKPSGLYLIPRLHNVSDVVSIITTFSFLFCKNKGYEYRTNISSTLILSYDVVVIQWITSCHK